MHSKVIPIAGNHFTNDLAIGLGIPIQRAEEIKKTHGFVWEERFLDLDRDNLEVDLGYENGIKKLETYSLFEILNPRAEEVFDLLCDEILKYRLQHFMPSGLVLTGGGSLLLGMPELAKNKFGIPIRIGIPASYKSDRFMVPDLIKSPIYATGYGLLVYASGQDRLDFTSGSSNSAVKKVFKRMKSWIYDFL